METLVERAERLGVATATVGEMLDELERLREKVDYLADGMRDVFPSAPTLNEAMLMLAKLRDSAYYPKGGYSSDVTGEWDAMLDAWFGEVRPCF